MMRTSASRSAQVVHLELHTSDREASSRFYSDLLEWQTDRIHTQWGCYHALKLGSGLDGGIVECGTRPASWLPYVAVDQIDAATDLARRLGARVLLAPREGPAGWRAVLSTPAGGEIALWQPKPRRLKVAR
jgi:predicted enzyme related to lactoylglutathione lyase